MTHTGYTLYVANSGSNTISVIDTNKNTKIKDIEVGENPFYLYHSFSSRLLYFQTLFLTLSL